MARSRRSALSWTLCLVLAPTLLLGACAEEPLTELGEARADFAEMSASHGDDYDYVSRREATAGGVSMVSIDDPHCVWTTTLEVRDGVVARRIVEVTDGGLEASCSGSFTEEGDELGANDSVHAAPAITLEQWYVLCEEEVVGTESSLGGIPTADIPYAFGEDGVLSTCGWMGADAGFVAYGTPFFTLVSLTWQD